MSKSSDKFKCMYLVSKSKYEELMNIQSRQNNLNILSGDSTTRWTNDRDNINIKPTVENNINVNCSSQPPKRRRKRVKKLSASDDDVNSGNDNNDKDNVNDNTTTDANINTNDHENSVANKEDTDIDMDMLRPIENFQRENNRIIDSIAQTNNSYLKSMGAQTDNPQTESIGVQSDNPQTQNIGVQTDNLHTKSANVQTYNSVPIPMKSIETQTQTLNKDKDIDTDTTIVKDFSTQTQEESNTTPNLSNRKLKSINKKINKQLTSGVPDYISTHNYRNSPLINDDIFDEDENMEDDTINENENENEKKKKSYILLNPPKLILKKIDSKAAINEIGKKYILPANLILKKNSKLNLKKKKNLIL